MRIPGTITAEIFDDYITRNNMTWINGLDRIMKRVPDRPTYKRRLTGRARGRRAWVYLIRKVFTNDR